MEDLIRRSDAIKAIEELPNAYNGWSDAYDKAYIIGTLEEVPSADRPQEWIPCEERMPEEPFDCLVTVEDSYFDGSGFIDCESILPYFVGWDGEQWNDCNGGRCPFEILAWMPLPEPWKGADDEVTTV